MAPNSMFAIQFARIPSIISRQSASKIALSYPISVSQLIASRKAIASASTGFRELRKSVDFALIKQLESEPQVKARYKLTSANERPQTPFYVMTEPAIYTFSSM